VTSSARPTSSSATSPPFAQLAERVRLDGVPVEVRGGAWQEPDDPSDPHDTPLVRTAIGKLRSLVVRTRCDEPGWTASAS